MSILEEQILELALERGMISDSDLADATRKVSAGDMGTGPWGARIEYLLRAGALDEETVRRLSREAERTIGPDESTAGLDHLTSPHTAGDEMPIQKQDRYTLESLLGEGGMGRVYKAFDTRLKRYVALKFIRYDSDDHLRRFIREAQAQARVIHEHVCRIYEVSEQQEKPYIAMQFIDGGTLSRRYKSMSLNERVAVLRDVSEGIHAAHRLGLIHRDIKPGNILVESREGELCAYITDFGLARPVESEDLTQVGRVLGTPAFMSPEQASGSRSLDRRSDVYSLGATLYAVASGRPPYEGNSPLEVLSSIALKDPVPVRQINKDIPRELETIILKCLEKEPEQRYDSARALADDLQRFLDGDPIQARPAGPAYRIGKWIRKNRAASAIAALAMIAVLLFAAFAVQSRLAARERARLAEEFGRRVEKIDAIMRYARMLPLHDVNNEKEIARTQIKQMEELMARLGPAAKGPGSYAMGRGYLALDDYGEARRRLEIARDAGYRQPDASYALGLVLVRLYEQELERVDRIQEPISRKAETLKIETELRDPALTMLKNARASGTESASYIAALMGFCEKQYESALKQAEEAVQQNPWLYEAVRLQGDIYLRRAVEARDKGDFSGAHEWTRKGDAAYRRAINMARSDSENYDRAGALWLTLIAMELYYSGEDVQPAFQSLMELADQGHKADSLNPSPLIRKSKALTALAGYKADHGEDNEDIVRKAIEAADLAIRMSPGSSDGYSARGVAFQQLAVTDMGKGRDPLPSLQASIEGYLKSVSIRPDDPSYNDLGYTYSMVSEYEAEHGRDPVPDLDRSIEAYQSALKVNPRSYISFNNLGISYDSKGLYEMEHGKDPTPSLNLALKNYQKALDLNPGFAFAVSNKGNCYLYLAEYDLRRNIDPAPRIENAVECFRKAIAINPRHANFYGNLAEAFLKSATYAVRNRRDPEALLVQADDAIRQALQLNNSDYYYYYLQTGVTLLRARYAIQEGRDAGPHLDRAAASAQKALALAPEDADVLVLSAEITLRTSESRFVRVQSASWNAAVQATKQVLSIQPDHPGALAVQGALLLQRCGTAPGASCEADRKLAHQLLARAKELDPSTALDFPQ